MSDESDESDFIPKIIKIMNTAEKLSDLNGKEKKDFVINTIIMDMPQEHVKYTEVLSLIIDGLCKVKKEHIIMAFNKASSCCLKF
jgi:hypothetical protein